MDAEQFLFSIWPDRGYYCIASPFASGRGFDQTVFETIPEAAKFALEQSRRGVEVYFNVHALGAPSVWNPKLKDGVGAWQVRTHANMQSCRAFFADIDVGSDKPYTTRKDAILALERFVTDTRLPKPTVVTSGGGFHVYWTLTTELASDDWMIAAKKLKAVANHFAFKVDPARTTDRSSVLRVPGTFNYKDRANPRPVEVKFAGKPTVTTEFLATLDRSSIFAAGSVAVPSSAVTLDAKPVSLVDVGKACGVVRELVKTADRHSEPEWHAFLGLMLYVDDGRTWAHKVSARYPTYDKFETDEKIEQVAERQTGPTRCQRFSDMGFSTICDKCWYVSQREKSSPVVAARRRPREHDPSDAIPEPPEPFRRVAAGGVVYVEDAVETVISPFDLYPAKLVVDQQGGERVMHADWCADLPNGRGVVTFRMPLRNIQEVTLSSKLADQGIVLEYDNLKHVRRYMTLYIQKLQQSMGDTKQHTHLGYADDYSEFVLPYTTIAAAGTQKPTIMGEDVRYSARAVARKGTLAEQVKAMTFYDDPCYRRNQFVIGCSFGSPLLHMTGQNGVIVNASGHSGASKSTSLYSAGSVWGDGETFTLNGTNSGMTPNARMYRMAVMSNLPTIIDEITYMDDREAKDLAMAVTQSQERIKLNRNSREAGGVAGQRSSIMITSSNGSLHEKLANRNVAGTASSMRIFEIAFPLTSRHTKREADDYLRTLRDHHGHMGSIFMQHVMPNFAAIKAQVIDMQRLVDDRGEIMPHERFWSAVIAASVIGLRTAKRLGLTTFDADAVLRWALEEQLPAMRGSIGTNYSDPLEMLLTYMNASKGDMLIVNTVNGNIVPLDKPQREVGIRYEVDTRTVYISINHLKNYCFKSNIAFGMMLDHLGSKHNAERMRFTIGRGVPEFSYGQVAALKINLQTEEIMGTVDYAVAETTDNVVALRRGLIR